MKKIGRFFKSHWPSLVAVTLITSSIIYLFKILPKTEIFGASIIHVLAGTVLAFIILILLLFYLRPRLIISPYICNTDGRYWFKIINRSIYHAFDVKIELFKMVPVPHSGGKSNVNIYPVSLRTSNWTSINRVRKGYSEKDPFSLFAQTIFTADDLYPELQKSGIYLELQLTARHGLTGLADRFTQQFPNETVIMIGHKFCYGDSTATMPENQAI